MTTPALGARPGLPPSRGRQFAFREQHQRPGKDGSAVSLGAPSAPAGSVWPLPSSQGAAPAVRQRRSRVVSRLLACAVLLGLGVAAVQAMSIRELRTLEANEKDGSAYASYYLVGVVEGLREASDTAQRAGQKPAFCVEGRRLEPSMARPIYQAELTRKADLYEADMPVPLVVSAALQSTFRCTQ